MITDEEFDKLFGETPPASLLQSPSRRIIDEAAEGISDTITAPVGVIEVTPGVRPPIYAEPDVGPLLYGNVSERPKPIQIKIGHLGVETKAQGPRPTKAFGIGGSGAHPGAVLSEEDPQTKRTFTSGARRVFTPGSKPTPPQFEVNEMVLVQVRQPQYTKGKLVLFDGRYHIIPATVETQHPLVKVIPPEHIASIAQEIISGEYEIKYDRVEFQKGVIMGRVPAGGTKRLYRVEVEGKSMVVDETRLLGLGINTGIVTLSSILLPFREYLKRSMIVTISEYDGVTSLDVVEWKDNWEGYCLSQFIPWVRGRHRQEWLLQLDLDEIKRKAVEIAFETPQPLEQIEARLVNEELERIEDAYVTTAEEETEFYDTHLHELRTKYLSVYPVIPDVGELDQLLVEQVSEYETYLFDVYGQRNLNTYLANFLFPMIFFSNLSPLQPYAKFFRAKLAGPERMVQIPQFPHYSLAEFLPELYIGTRVVDGVRFAEEERLEEFYELIRHILEELCEYVKQAFMANLDPLFQFDLHAQPVGDPVLLEMLSDVGKLCGELNLKDAKICLKEDTFTCEVIQ
jgi:hypothetical protein